jgi:hypothetical protein
MKLFARCAAMRHANLAPEQALPTANGTKLIAADSSRMVKYG